MKRLIIFLVRRKLGLKKYQTFKFTNQKFKNKTYYFTSDCLYKTEGCKVEPSDVSLYWLLNDDCKIEKLGTRRL